MWGAFLTNIQFVTAIIYRCYNLNTTRYLNVHLSLGTNNLRQEYVVVIKG